MKKTIASAALSLALMSSAAMAEERSTDAALGAVSGALVLGPIGAVAGALVGYSAGPSIASSWGLRGSSTTRQARRAAGPDARVPARSEPVPNQSAPKDQATPQAAAPARPSAITTASTAPPVQPLE